MKKNTSQKRILSLILILIVLATGNVFADTRDDMLQDIKEPMHTSLDSPQCGIVEIITGVEKNGDFLGIKKSCGVIINNSADGTYILTTEHNTRISEKEKKKNDIETNVTTDIMAAVKGDVLTELSIVTKSKKSDFCILKADNVISERSEVTISSFLPSEGETVYAFGFSDDDIEQPNFQFLPEDVSMIEGKVLNTKTDINGHDYISHSVKIEKGFNGGILTDSSGYVVGLNNYKVSDDNNYYSLPMSEIERVLVNYGIGYNSISLEAVYEKTYDEYVKCLDAALSKKYTSKSVQNLMSVLENSRNILINESDKIESLTDAEKKMNAAYSELILKTPKILYLIYGFAAVIALLLGKLISLIIWHKKNIKDSRNDDKSTNVLEKEKQPPTIDISEKRNEARHIYRSITDKKPEVINEQIKARLIEVKTNSMIEIDKSEFTIGKNEKLVDFAISNSTVSRLHAQIVKKDNEFWLYDLGSTNGTFVNNKQVKDVEVKLNNNDIIRLSNVELIFKTAFDN